MPVQLLQLCFLFRSIAPGIENWEMAAEASLGYRPQLGEVELLTGWEKFGCQTTSEHSRRSVVATLRLPPIGHPEALREDLLSQRPPQTR